MVAPENLQLKVTCIMAVRVNAHYHYRFAASYADKPPAAAKQYWKTAPTLDIAMTIKGHKRYEEGKDYVLAVG